MKKNKKKRDEEEEKEEEEKKKIIRQGFVVINSPYCRVGWKNNSFLF
jgi:hypothetical protein